MPNRPHYPHILTRLNEYMRTIDQDRRELCYRLLVEEFELFWAQLDDEVRHQLKFRVGGHGLAMNKLHKACDAGFEAFVKAGGAK